MADSEDFQNMPITKVVKAWMDSKEWDDEIEISDDRTSSTVATRFSINDQGYPLYLETREKAEIFAVYLYTPFKVPVPRIRDMAVIVNRINDAIGLGRLSVADKGEAAEVRYIGKIDVEGGTLAPQQVGTLVDASVNIMSQHAELLAAVALTKQPIDQLWTSFLEDMEKKEAEDESGPTEL